MQRDFDRYGRPAPGQHTTHQTTSTSSRSRPSDYTGQPILGANSMRGDNPPGRYGQDRSRSAPAWINELPRDYPLPPPERPAAPPRTRPVRFAQARTVTPSQSISQVDRQSGQGFQNTRTTVARGEMPRGSSSLVRGSSNSQFVNRADVPSYGQGPNTSYRPSYPPMGQAGPEMPRVVNNYITTTNHQTFNIDNSRHQRVNAQGQRNTQNIQYASTTNNRLHHHRGRHNHREYRG